MTVMKYLIGAARIFSELKHMINFKYVENLRMSQLSHSQSGCRVAALIVCTVVTVRYIKLITNYFIIIYFNLILFDKYFYCFQNGDIPRNLIANVERISSASSAFSCATSL